MLSTKHSTPMKLLLTNDDGYDAHGIQALIAALHAEHELFVTAPATHQSGKSHSITTSGSVKIEEVPDQRCTAFYKIWGSPADCARIGLLIAKQRGFVPDLVVSGINLGLNTGADLCYSGTFGAATEATLLGFKAVAMSNESFTEESSAEAARLGPWIRRAVELAMRGPDGAVLNVNYPYGREIKGFKETSLTQTSYYDIPLNIDLQGGCGSLGQIIPTYGVTSGSDVEAVLEGFVSVSWVPGRRQVVLGAPGWMEGKLPVIGQEQEVK